MRVQELMTEKPVCCESTATLQEVAQAMATCDCGEIPIVDNGNNRKLVGVVTDRDIACRAVAEGKDPRRTFARDVMTTPVVYVTPGADVEECFKKMEQNQIRRLPVLDEFGSCCGIVSQADIARLASDHATAEVVRDISRPARRMPGGFEAPAGSSILLPP
jgi:CBS domain-containing protein